MHEFELPGSPMSEAQQQPVPPELTPQQQFLQLLERIEQELPPQNVEDYYSGEFDQNDIRQLCDTINKLKDAIKDFKKRFNDWKAEGENQKKSIDFLQKYAFEMNFAAGVQYFQIFARAQSLLNELESINNPSSGRKGCCFPHLIFICSCWQKSLSKRRSERKSWCDECAGCFHFSW